MQNGPNSAATGGVAIERQSLCLLPIASSQIARLQTPLRSARARLLLGFLAAAALATGFRAQFAHAQTSPNFVPALSQPAAPSGKKKSSKAQSPPDELKPEISIAAGPLGFAPPAPFYLGSRVSQVSLDFLDEDHLLFTFRVPGLISREHTAASQPPGEEPTIDEKHNERHIRAVVIDLPSGKVTAEALWRLHDSAPYLYPLKNKKFLLRDRNTVRVGDASLHLDLFLRFPGTVRNLELGPDQRLLVANTVEAAAHDPEEQASTKPSLYQQDPRPSSAASSNASGSVTTSPGSLNSAVTPPSSTFSAEAGESADQDLLRILRMDNRSVVLFSRVDGVRYIPIDGDGFYEALRGHGTSWVISFQDFQGASIPLQPVDSTCSPTLDVMAPGIVLASACAPGGGRALTAITRDKQRLWDLPIGPNKIWPRLATSQNGSRMARETLDVNHAIGPNYPLDASDVRGQSVQVYDLGTGKLDLTVSTSPILDGGGNFALSPSGGKLAVLNAGAIQIFDLPSPALSPTAQPSTAPALPSPPK